ncbi:hypothetical protein [Pontibacterium sp.]|uniref:hypothetical protein n=1 Tax=Pontibacterium sp. TaxID=2036026 RepID=UPI00356656BA
MTTYRAEVIIERIVYVEVESESAGNARDAIQDNWGRQVGDAIYRSSRIEKITIVEDGSQYELF